MSAQPIHEAMLRVGDAIRYMQKRGRNAQQSYDYVTDADVREAFHRELQRNGVIAAPSVLECSVEPHMSGQDRKGYLTTLRLQVDLIHVESGSTHTAQAVGCGYDSTDKGANKAYTSAIKNYLLTTFLVPSGSDAERDEDGQVFNAEAIESTFDSITARLKKCEPKKNEHKALIESIVSGFQTESKRPVLHPREFRTRTDALGALAALKQFARRWEADQVNDEADAGQARERAEEVLTAEKANAKA